MGAEHLNAKVAYILLTKSGAVLCLESNGRSPGWQSNCCVRAPLKTNCMSKIVKTLSYKNLFQHPGSYRDRNNSDYHFEAHLERMSMYHLRDNSCLKNESSLYYVLLKELCCCCCFCYCYCGLHCFPPLPGFQLFGWAVTTKSKAMNPTYQCHIKVTKTASRLEKKLLLLKDMTRAVEQDELEIPFSCGLLKNYCECNTS